MVLVTVVSKLDRLSISLSLADLPLVGAGSRCQTGTPLLIVVFNLHSPIENKSWISTPPLGPRSQQCRFRFALKYFSNFPHGMMEETEQNRSLISLVRTFEASETHERRRTIWQTTCMHAWKFLETVEAVNGRSAGGISLIGPFRAVTNRNSLLYLRLLRG